MRIPSRNVRRALWVGAALALATAAALIVSAVRDHRARERLAAALALASARGEPVSLADLAGRVPDGATDAGAALLSELVELSAEVGDPATSWPRGHDWYAVVPGDVVRDDPEVVAFVERHGPRLDRIEAAVRAGTLRFAARTDAQGFPAPAKVEAVTRARLLLGARARTSEAADGRVGTVESMALLARRWQCRTLIEHLVAATVLEGAAQQTLDGLRCGRLPPASVQERIVPLLAADTLAWYPEMLREERVFDIAVLDSLVDLPGVDDDLPAPRLAAPPCDLRTEIELQVAGGALVDAAAESLEVSLAAVAVPTRSHREHTAAVAALYAPFRARKRPWLPWYHLREQALLASGVMGRFTDTLTRVDAHLRLARVATAVELFREAHGTCPASLDDLAPWFPAGVPDDPWNERPFELSAEDGVPVLRSRGAVGAPWSDPAGPLEWRGGRR